MTIPPRKIEDILGFRARALWFGFKDDVVIRLRHDNGMTLIDLRSVSRVGMSDLGANANRIAHFLEEFDR